MSVCIFVLVRIEGLHQHPHVIIMDPQAPAPEVVLATKLLAEACGSVKYVLNLQTIADTNL